MKEINKIEQEQMSKLIWEAWEKDDRVNFLLDHKNLFNGITLPPIDTLTSNDNYHSLPKTVKKILKSNIDFDKKKRK